ncbi:MAG: hypothetical protein WAO91_01690 [Candidatus Nitrosotenuis sp.]
MNENKKEIFADEQRRELDRMFLLVRERDEKILDILEDIQTQIRKGAYNDIIDKKIDRLRDIITKS